MKEKVQGFPEVLLAGQAIYDVYLLRPGLNKRYGKLIHKVRNKEAKAFPVKVSFKSFLPYTKEVIFLSANAPGAG